MKTKKIAILSLALLLALPAMAVFNEKDLSNTLSVLRCELKQEVEKSPMREGRIGSRNISQHRQLIEMMKKCNELSLMLYSQSQDYTFDMTYALKEVTKEYETFNKQKMPFDDIVRRLDLEIDRYTRLIESLRRLPPRLRKMENLPDSIRRRIDSLSFRSPAATAGDAVVRFMMDSLNNRGHLSAFFLDRQGQEDRDSCVAYATTLLNMYSEAKNQIIEDNEHYEDADARLKESYDYAQERYKDLRRRIFVGGQDNYLTVLRTFPAYCSRAFEDAAGKYGRSFALDGDLARSVWRGPMVLSFLALMLFYLVLAIVVSKLLVVLMSKRFSALRENGFISKKLSVTIIGIIIFALTNCIFYFSTGNNFFQMASGQLIVLSWLLAAIVASVMVRNRDKDAAEGMRLYLPIIVMGIVVIAFRVIFIPNRVMNLLFSPLLIAFFIWQIVTCVKFKWKLEESDKVIAWISVGVLGVTSLMSLLGFVLLAMQVLIWWLFQIAAVETVMILNLLLKWYEGKYVAKWKKDYSENSKRLGHAHFKGEYIRVTWMHDFLSMTVIPVVAIISFPLTIFLALNVFDLTDVYRQIMYTTFFDFVDASGKEILKVSLYMIILASSLFFLFKYLNYLVKSLYRDIKLNRISKATGKSYIHTNEVNLTLADNVISILVWGTYIIITIILLRIPTGAVSIIAAGLATGLGLAMKDILNNFIYGIQLMSGRLRVGDWMECDGVRGKVTAISYQSTQMETIDGAVISFLNTALFNKNFKNLTKNNDYEFVKISVGVAYGTDVEKVRGILLEAFKSLQSKDKYNRNIVDAKSGVSVAFDDFGDSAVNIAIKQNVLVSERNAYIAKAKELLYNVLNENGITIPFPQRDIHVVK